MTTKATIKLKVPRQELDQCSFFNDSEASVEQWIEALPMANLGQATHQLFLAITELNQVRMLPTKRAALLEKLRAPTHSVSNSLSQHYLNQPMVLPEKIHKITELAHSLHSQLAIGYTIVALHTRALNKTTIDAKSAASIAHAVVRAITDYTLNMQRHYQLYEPVSSNLWHKVHQLYLLAKHSDALDHFVDDAEFGNSTVKGCYTRTLLLGCSKPNQLRQEDFAELFKPLTQWANLCQLTPLNGQDLFFVDPAKDHAPVYRELIETIPNNECLSLNTQQLLDELLQLHKQTDPGRFKCQGDGYQISQDLISHLIVAWGSMCKRNYMRLEANDALELCVGFCATHYYVSDELALEALVAARGQQVFSLEPENPFLKTPPSLHQPQDRWERSYENNLEQTSLSVASVNYEIGKNEQRTEKALNKYGHHSAHMINSSAHGYCIEWLEESEVHIKTGEIVGIKSISSNNWSIAAIRWVSRCAGRTQLGVQIISANAAPYGARIIHKTGGDKTFSRVLVLPEVPAIQQAKTLLTPRMPFREGMKLILSQRGKETQVQLTKKLNETGSFNQFEFRILSGTNIAPRSSDNPHSLDESNFNSLWDVL